MNLTLILLVINLDKYTASPCLMLPHLALVCYCVIETKVFV